jgi:hypothetical protein
MKQCGRSSSVTRLVIVNGMRKWMARHVTVSPRPMGPEVTPAVARSFDAAIKARCA